MLKRNMLVKKIFTTVIVLSMVLQMTAVAGAKETKKLEKDTIHYIVVTQNQKMYEQIAEDYQVHMVEECDMQEELKEENIFVAEMTVDEAEELENQIGVVAVEEDIELVASGNNRNKKKFKNKKNDNVNTESEWNVKMIRAEGKDRMLFGRKAKIAVIDSGVDETNDINVVKRINLVEDEQDVSPMFEDTTKHGTAIASLIGAKENDIGITGINPGAEIYSAKVLDRNNKAPISRVVKGIYWAIENEVDIICLSMGTTTKSSVLEQAVKDAYKKGILIIAAAGNGGETEKSTVEYPAAFDEVIAVGAVDSMGERTAESAVGEELEIMAPGELVKTAGAFQGTSICSGTSMAVPHIVAVASILWEKDFSKSNQFIRQLLQVGANSIGDKKYYGYGLVDLSYCEEIYSDFEEKYKIEDTVNENDIFLNTNAIIVEENTGYVEGSWGKNIHTDMVEEAKRLNSLSKNSMEYVVKGATIADIT